MKFSNLTFSSVLSPPLVLLYHSSTDLYHTNKNYSKDYKVYNWMSVFQLGQSTTSRIEVVDGSTTAFTLECFHYCACTWRNFEAEAVVRASRRHCVKSLITTRELVGFNDLPRSISTELSAQLPTIPSLKSTVDALDSGFPLIIRPILDYYFSVNSKFKLNILFTIPSLTAYNEFCTLQSLTPLKYNVSGVCFTFPLLCAHSCPSQVLYYNWSRPVSKIPSP